MKLHLLTIFVLRFLANTDGASQLRGVERKLANVTTYPNGTQVLDNGNYVRDPADVAENPGSIIWMGQGRDPNAGSVGVDMGGLTCFSAVATVQTPSGIMAMKNLRVGDQILTGKRRFETVYAFAHRNPERAAEFVAIQTEDETLEITAPHLVFLEGRNNPIRAEYVKVGDVLGGGKIVANIDTLRRNGVYAPLTRSGTLLVNGVVSSSYVALQDTPTVVLGGLQTSLSHHQYCQTGMAPFRLYCSLSNKFCTDYTDDGMPPFVEFGIWLSHAAFAHNFLFQFLYMAGFFVTAGICWLLETSLGWVAAGTLWLLWGRNRRGSMRHRTKGHCSRHDYIKRRSSDD